MLEASEVQVQLLFGFWRLVSETPVGRLAWSLIGSELLSVAAEFLTSSSTVPEDPPRSFCPATLEALAVSWMSVAGTRLSSRLLMSVSPSTSLTSTLTVTVWEVPAGMIGPV